MCIKLLSHVQQETIKRLLGQVGPSFERDELKRRQQGQPPRYRIGLLLAGKFFDAASA